MRGSDDPDVFVNVVCQLADTFSVLNKAEVARAVKVLATVATDDSNPLQSVATIAMQIMAQAYNEGGTK
jgi:hypothetical protein